jgi:LysR family transcriptional regulator, carnitine catabolism transcriptional activator
MIEKVTLKQLRAFLSVVTERSFTRAAARLHLSQSALTLQISALESELGVKLLTRSTRSVELTPEGADLHPVIERIVDQLSRALSNAQTTSDRTAGSVAVAAGSSIISLVIAPAVVRLGESHPGISVRIIEHAGRGLASRVIKGEADFGISALSNSSPDLNSLLLLKDRFGVMCRSDHPLARKSGKITWSDLATHPFVMLARGTDTREMLATHPAIGPLLPQPSFEVASLSALFSLVERGAGFTLLPGIAALPAVRQRLVFRPIHKPPMNRELYFVSERRHSLTPAARRLAFTIVDEIRKLKKDSSLKGLVDIASGVAAFQKQLV